MNTDKAAALSALLSNIKPTHPVTLDDVLAIRQLIEQQIGKLPGLEIFHRIREVFVRVFPIPVVHFTPDYEYRMTVEGVPANYQGRK